MTQEGRARRTAARRCLSECLQCRMRGDPGRQLFLALVSSLLSPRSACSCRLVLHSNEETGGWKWNTSVRKTQTNSNSYTVQRDCCYPATLFGAGVKFTWDVRCDFDLTRQWTPASAWSVAVDGNVNSQLWAAELLPAAVSSWVATTDCSASHSFCPPSPPPTPSSALGTNGRKKHYLKLDDTTFSFGEL